MYHFPGVVSEVDVKLTRQYSGRDDVCWKGLSVIRIGIYSIVWIQLDGTFANEAWFLDAGFTSCFLIFSNVRNDVFKWKNGVLLPNKSNTWVSEF